MAVIAVPNQPHTCAVGGGVFLDSAGNGFTLSDQGTALPAIYGLAIGTIMSCDKCSQYYEVVPMSALRGNPALLGVGYRRMSRRESKRARRRFA